MPDDPQQPFPFVHAQLTSFFVLVVVGFMPVLMLTFINNMIFGFFMNLLTVMCFTGLHEVRVLPLEAQAIVSIAAPTIVLTLPFHRWPASSRIPFKMSPTVRVAVAARTCWSPRQLLLLLL